MVATRWWLLHLWLLDDSSFNQKYFFIIIVYEFMNLCRTFFHKLVNVFLLFIFVLFLMHFFFFFFFYSPEKKIQFCQNDRSEITPAMSTRNEFHFGAFYVNRYKRLTRHRIENILFHPKWKLMYPLILSSSLFLKNKELWIKIHIEVSFRPFRNWWIIV